MRRFRHLLLTLAILALPFVAQATHDPNLVVQQAEFLSPFLVKVSGTINCDVAGAFYGVSVQIIQRGGRTGSVSGSGGFGDECSSMGPTTWVVNVLGGPFHPGSATIIAGGTVCSNHCAFDDDARQIRLRQ